MKLGGSKAGRVEISPTMGKTRTLTHLKPKCHHDIESRDKVKRNMFQVDKVFCNPEVKPPHLPFQLSFKSWTVSLATKFDTGFHRLV